MLEHGASYQLCVFLTDLWLHTFVFPSDEAGKQFVFLVVRQYRWCWLDQGCRTGITQRLGARFSCWCWVGARFRGKSLPSGRLKLIVCPRIHEKKCSWNCPKINNMQTVYWSPELLSACWAICRGMLHLPWCLSLGHDLCYGCGYGCSLHASACVQGLKLHAK